MVVELSRPGTGYRGASHTDLALPNGLVDARVAKDGMDDDLWSKLEDVLEERPAA